jgi:lactate dehydrogenase-like 2-hydroxyacid dehydrogenase
MVEPDYMTANLWEYGELTALAADKGEDIRVIATYSGLRVGRELVEALPRLGLIAAVSAGYEGIDIAHAHSRGIQVVTGAGANKDDVAELAMALLLALITGLEEAGRHVREGRWTDTNRGPLRRSLHGKRVGIVGLGAVGCAVAERLIPFGCAISWFGPNPKPHVPWARARSLKALARESDVLIISAPLNATTSLLIDRSVINALGSNGLLVNVSRGGLVDEVALINALKSGALGGAALDVQAVEPTPPLAWNGVPNVILTPHIGGYASRAMGLIEEMLRENIRRFLAGESPIRPVPFDPVIEGNG